jgi:sulfide dehydrogenase cytochrome subunit
MYLNLEETLLVKQYSRRGSMNGFMRLFLLLIGIGLQHYSPSSIAEGVDGVNGQTKASPLAVQPCFPCHGPQGQSGSPAIPSLAGLPRDYLLEILRAYRYGGRFGTVMSRIVQAYDEADLITMADYFSQQPFSFPRQDVDWRLVDRGRKLHRYYCRECHGDPKTPAEAGVPQLHGHWIDYLRWTLWDYLVGINQGDDEMSDKLALLMRRQGNEGLEALLHYYASAKP